MKNVQKTEKNTETLFVVEEGKQRRNLSMLSIATNRYWNIILFSLLSFDVLYNGGFTRAGKA